MSPDITQINARQPASHRRRFKVSTVRFVDYHGTRVGFAAEVVAAQECAPSRFAPLSENVADKHHFPVDVDRVYPSGTAIQPTAILSTVNPAFAAAAHWRTSADTNTSTLSASALAMWIASMPRRTLFSRQLNAC